jgi:hypothetical protein
MNRHTSSVVAFSSCAAAAMLAATVMAGSARADDITIDNTPFVSTKTRTEVQAELFSQRDQVASSGYEWKLQRNQPQPSVSGYTREQARAEYIASREQVHAMMSEDSGSATLAQIRSKAPTSTAVAASSR